MSSDLDLEAIRARADAATAGPWEQPAYPSGTMVYRVVDHSPAGLIAQCERAADTDFIAHAPKDVPALLDRIAELKRENAALLNEVCDDENRITNLEADQLHSARVGMKMAGDTIEAERKLAAALAIVRAVAAGFNRVEGNSLTGAATRTRYVVTVYSDTDIREQARALLAGETETREEAEK